MGEVHGMTYKCSRGSKDGDVEHGAVQWEGIMWLRKFGGKEMKLDFTLSVSIHMLEVLGVLAISLPSLLLWG
jgi:hypothetical protein